MSMDLIDGRISALCTLVAAHCAKLCDSLGKHGPDEHSNMVENTPRREDYANAIRKEFGIES